MASTLVTNANGVSLKRIGDFNKFIDTTYIDTTYIDNTAHFCAAERLAPCAGRA